ncbi:ornithine carbamoyltransferase [Variovorax beijingensis]|uniref:Ornithine carbamoyltransferase n=2 Tax=Variovorax TaxID=34072 RepID=A0AAE3XZ59_VARPD|nr:MULTISPECIES: ornithine carbamoyltransferase [Variovorax]MDR6427420.1 ornithine carbamoyltransferase [Variovorax paradoxus]MDR6454582.1 ornithine carbamoyltransferase [Variovorax paradoxus]TWD85661.1 ornithine carbamoyltransferase [Variovorax beijingensis]
MLFPFENHNVSAFHALSPAEETALVGRARLLQAAFLRGALSPQLKGKKLGILCDEGADGTESRLLFQHAAEELGAHVARIRPALSNLGSPGEVRHTARILGRFYDALECQGMAPEVVRQIGLEAGIPVYDGLACVSHSTARLAELLDERTSPADNRRFVLQALLLGSVA